MQIVLYKKFEGIFKKIEEEYLESRIITNRYTPEELSNWKHIDLYFILGIDSLKNHDVLDDKLLTEQHRKQVLKYHPDINKHSKDVFLVIQKAYTVLKNPLMRIKYDSIHLDESIPEDREYSDNEFYVLFGPVFVRNSKFSKITPTPSFGDPTTNVTEVEKFYKFWQVFESIRNFEFYDEEDYEGMNRDERKYHEKKNKASREKYKRDDILRIKRLVSIAIKRDPRLQTLRKKNVTKQLSQIKINVNPKLIKNGWNEDEILKLYNIMNKNKIKEKFEWEKIYQILLMESNHTRELKDVIIKGNEIFRMGIKK
ncbi:Zuotin [Conglomerata obtusa]